MFGELLSLLGWLSVSNLLLKVVVGEVGEEEDKGEEEEDKKEAKEEEEEMVRNAKQHNFGQRSCNYCITQ